MASHKVPKTAPKYSIRGISNYCAQEKSRERVPEAAMNTYGFQSAADSSTGIVFKPDIFESEITTSSSQIRSEAPKQSSSMIGEQRLHEIGEQCPQASSLRTETRGKDQCVASQGSQAKRRLSSVHPAFRPRPSSGRAGDVAALDDRIVRNGGTTSTYEQLPHQLQMSKHCRLVTPAERILELTRTNGYLLQELAYHKDMREAEIEFHETVSEIRTKLEDALMQRLRKRAGAESTLLSYGGIDFCDGNVEDAVF